MQVPCAQQSLLDAFAACVLHPNITHVSVSFDSSQPNWGLVVSECSVNHGTSSNENEMSQPAQTEKPNIVTSSSTISAWAN